MLHFALKSAIVLEAGGKDCSRYLEARLTNKIKTLPSGALTLAAALNPQGKIQAFFSVFKFEESRYLLQCDGGEPEQIISALKQYIVADRVEVRDLSDQMTVLRVYPGGRAAALLDKLALPSQSYQKLAAAVAANFGYVSVRPLPAGLCIDLLCRNEALAELLSWLGELGSRKMDPETYLLQRLRLDQLVFPDELKPDSLFADGVLEDSVSYNKGCYVGQEVMEKVASRGKAPHCIKRLLISGRSDLHQGAEIFEQGAGAGASQSTRALGKVLSSAYDVEQDSTLCFASLRNQSSYAGLTVNGRPAQVC